MILCFRNNKLFFHNVSRCLCSFAPLLSQQNNPSDGEMNDQVFEVNLCLWCEHFAFSFQQWCGMSQDVQMDFQLASSSAQVREFFKFLIHHLEHKIFSIIFSDSYIGTLSCICKNAPKPYFVGKRS